MYFNIDGMLENLSSTSQQELVDILRLRYTLWIAMDMESKNCRLNQIFQTLVILYYCLRPQLQLLTVESHFWEYDLRPHLEVVPKLVTARALNIQLVARLRGCRVESQWKKTSQPQKDDAHLPALVARVPASHMWTL